MIIVRQGELRDTAWILEELKKFATFLGTDRSLFPNDDYAKAKLEEMIEAHFICVAESTIMNAHAGTCVGFIAGIMGPHFFNPEIVVLTELFWWVTPEARGTRAGALLFREFMRYGEKAHMIVMTLEEKSPVAEESLLKHGFKRYERNYVKEIV